MTEKNWRWEDPITLEVGDRVWKLDGFATVAKRQVMPDGHVAVDFEGIPNTSLYGPDAQIKVETP